MLFSYLKKIIINIKNNYTTSEKILENELIIVVPWGKTGDIGRQNVFYVQVVLDIQINYINIIIYNDNT